MLIFQGADFVLVQYQRSEGEHLKVTKMKEDHSSLHFRSRYKPVKMDYHLKHTRILRLKIIDFFVLYYVFYVGLL